LEKLSRRQVLKVAAAAGVGAAVSAVGAEGAIAADAPIATTPSGATGSNSGRTLKPLALPPPVPGITYKYFRGQDFKVRNAATTWSFSSTGADLFLTAMPDFVPCRIDLPQGSVVTEFRIDVIHSAAGAGMRFAFTSFYGPTDTFTDLLSGTFNVPQPGVQTLGFPLGMFSPITVDNNTFSYVLYWHPGDVGVNHRLVGARIGYVNGSPGLTTFPDPRRCLGNGTSTLAGTSLLNIDATQKIAASGPTGVPVGAKAALCAVQAYQPGVMTLYAADSPDPGVANWSVNGTPGTLQMLYMLVPLNQAGKFNIHNYSTDKQIYVDVWGYLA
jgi:TAT (twin-arginine translocation) pathway signal sequence